jgi:hypothetical protein
MYILNLLAFCGTPVHQETNIKINSKNLQLLFRMSGGGGICDLLIFDQV